MHATVTAWLAVSMRLRLRHATSDGRHEACKHECVIDGGGMGVHVPQSIRFANRWPCCTLDSDSFRDASARVPFTSNPTADLTVRKMLAHMSTFVHVVDKMRRR